MYLMIKPFNLKLYHNPFLCFNVFKCSVMLCPVFLLTLTSISASGRVKNQPTSANLIGNFTLLFKSEGNNHVYQFNHQKSGEFKHQVSSSSYGDINDTIQKVNSDLQRLRDLLKTDLDRRALLKAVRSAEHGLEELMNVEKLELPKRMRGKVDQLMQSLQNIKVTLLSMLEEPEPSMSHLEEYLTSVENDLRRIEKDRSGEEIVRILVKFYTVLEMVRMNEQKIPEELLKKIEHLKNQLTEYGSIIQVKVNSLRTNESGENHKENTGTENRSSSYLVSVLDENMIRRMLNRSASHVLLRVETTYNVDAAMDVLEKHIEYIENNLVGGNNARFVMEIGDNLDQIESILKLFDAKNTKLNIKLKISSLLERVNKLRVVVKKAVQENQVNPREEYEIENKPFVIQDKQNVKENESKFVNNTVYSVENRIKRVEEEVKSIQIEYEKYNNGNLSISFPPLTQMEHILEEFYLIEREVIPETLFERMEKLEENINKYKDYLNITLVQHYEPNIPPEPLKLTYERIASLTDEVDHIIDILNNKSSLAIVGQIKNRLVEMQKELQSLERGQNLPYYMTTNIKIMKNKVSSILKTINEIESVKTQLQGLDREFRSLKDQLKYKKRLNELNEKVQKISNDLSTLSFKIIPKYLLDEIDQFRNDIAVFMSELKLTSKTEEGVFNETVDGLKQEFDRLREQYNSETNTQTRSLQEVLKQIKVVLKQLEEQSVKYTSKASKKMVQDFKKGIKMFEEKINQKLKEKEEAKKNPENIWDETVFTFQNAEEHIKRLESKLAQIKSNFLLESEPSKLTKLYYEVNSLRSEAQMMNFRKFPPKLQSRIKDFLKECDFVIQTIEQRVGKEIGRGSKPKYDVTRKPDSKQYQVMQVNETELIIKKLKFNFGNIKYMLRTENNVTSLMNLYSEIEHMLAEIQVFILEGFPKNFKHEIITFKEEVKQILIDVEERIHGRIAKENNNQGVKGVENGNKNDIKYIETRVDKIFNELQQLRGQLNPKQPQTQLKIRLKFLVEVLHLIEVDSLPDYLINKIKTLQHVASDIREKLEENITNLSKPSDDFENVNAMIQLRVEALEKNLQILKNKFLFDNDESIVIQRHYEIDQILEDITRLKVQNVPGELKTKIHVLEENAMNFKEATEHFIRLRILTPIVDYIDDILLQLDRHLVSRFRIITRRRIEAAKEDLKRLREEIKTLTNYELVEEIYRHLNGILYRLEDLKGCHVSDVIDMAITKFYAHIKYLNNDLLSKV